MLIKLLIFLSASAGLAYLSRASLSRVGSHGFHRFFAWEAILLVILLNIDDWFHRPFSSTQIASWSLLLASLYFLIHGVQSLRSVGKPDRRREDPSLFGIEKTTVLVTVGAYKHVRHPIYASLLFLVWGAFFKSISVLGAGLAALATFFLISTAKAEEVENARYFGVAYGEYMKRTKMFVPFLF